MSFEKGDVVKLKSGSPKMVVVNWHEDQFLEGKPPSLTCRRRYICQWFTVKGDLRREDFSEIVLKPGTKKKRRKDGLTGIIFAGNEI